MSDIPTTTFDDSEDMPLELEMFLIPQMIAKGPGELPGIPDEAIKARSFEFLRASLDPQTSGVVTNTALLFRNPAHIGLALGEIVRNLAQAYANAGFTLGGVAVPQDAIADMIYTQIAEHAFTEDRTIHSDALMHAAPAGEA